MDIKIIDPETHKEEVQTDIPVKVNEPLEGAALPQLERKAIAEMMGIERDSEIAQYDDKLNILLKYAKDTTDDHSIEGLRWAVRSLEMKLGSPPLGEKMVTWMAQYAYLTDQRFKIDKDLKKFQEYKK